MKLVYKKISFLAFMLVLAGLSMTGCKKSSSGTPDTTNPGSEITPGVPTTGTRAQLTKDSIYLYAKQIYLWNDAIPSYEVFNPRKYTQFSTELDNYNKELFDLTQLKVNPVTGKPYEYLSATANYPKYSYITSSDANAPVSVAAPVVSQVTLEGVGSDFGIALSAIGSASSYQIYVRYVSAGSPADKNSIHRGDLIQTINGRALGAGFTADQNYIETAFDQASITLSGKKSNGVSFTRTLSKATYNSSPVYKDTVITVSGKKIGYIAFARFSNPNNATAPLNASFSKFASNGVTSLVVDLRYNGGGYVATAEYMANLIAPPSINGSKMFTEYYNSTLQNGQATILKNQPLLTSSGQPQYKNGKLVTYFDVNYSATASDNTHSFVKAGSLNTVTKVVFLVSGSTASASELVINVLKPYLDVKLMGSTTYGKPVGFFPVTIDAYDVYFSMFQTKNSLGEGEYFAGFTPNAPATDDVIHDFGDPAEAEFAAAINYIVNGTLNAKAPVATIMGTKTTISSSDINNIGRDESFKGMIETRYGLK